MKRTYCDCCGNEYEPTDVNLTLFQEQGLNKSVYMRRYGERPEADKSLNFKIAVKVTREHPRWSNHQEEILDICSNCYWQMLDKLDPRPKQALEVNENSIVRKHIDNIVGDPTVLDALVEFVTNSITLPDELVDESGARLIHKSVVSTLGHLKAAL